MRTRLLAGGDGPDGLELTPRTVAAVLIGLFCLALPAPGASIQGVVLERTTGRPLARTSVRLETETGGARTGVTDGGGRFAFHALTPGAYRLAAERRHFAAARFGQAGWEAPGNAIVLERDSVFSATLSLRRLGVITGTVVDENGVGMSEVAVTAIQLGTRLRNAARQETDERGRFRLTGLVPGRYVVRTGARTQGDVTLLPTFAGQTASLSEARQWDVHLDAEQDAGVIEPLAGRLTSLSIVVSPPVSAKIMVQTPFGPLRHDTAADGTVSLRDLPPGPYQISAEADINGQPWGGLTRITLGDGAQTASVELRHAPTVRVRCEDATGKPTREGVDGVFLRRPGEEESGFRQLRCEENAALAPGTWEVGIMTTASRYAARIGPVTPGNATSLLQVEPGQAVDFAVRLSGRTASLAGKAANLDGSPAPGAPVFVRPDDPDLASRVGGVRMVRADHEGRFQVPGLAPGTYSLLSTYDTRRPEQAILLTAWQPVTLAEGEQRDVEVRIAPGTPW